MKLWLPCTGAPSRPGVDKPSDLYNGIADDQELAAAWSKNTEQPCTHSRQNSVAPDHELQWGRLHLCNRLQAGREVLGKLQAFMSVQQTGALTPHPGSDAQSRGLMYPILYLCNGLQAGQEEQVKLHGPGSHSCQRSLLGGAQGGTVQAGHICR